ncbi:ROK family protein [Caulobacter sp. NIBR2454]|uniref:ROK family protein n=1 Tax=Caulobacter sp. NIBR2454 TaxID=3015996 RepID=UPI0022B638A8|nr:ROK family protein [Caulobacter sp. NIBR2454]
MQIGVDFGGTKIEAAALDAEGRFLARLREPNPGDYDAAIAAVVDLIARVEAKVGEQGSVGIGGPGSVSPRSGLMRNSNSTYLNGRPFDVDLAKALGRPIRMENDANCLALSEAVDGAGAGAKGVFAIIVGTGCGGGVVFDGRLITGANAIAGEWGHTPLPWPRGDELPGHTCWCGQINCLETWVSGTGFGRDYGSATGKELTGEAIIAAMRAGEAEAMAAFDRYVDRLGRAMAVVCNLIDPDVFILGGGMSNVGELYERLPAVIRSHVFSDAWDAKIAPAQWGDSSGVRGAARLWPAPD